MGNLGLDLVNLGTGNGYRVVCLSLIRLSWTAGAGIRLSSGAARAEPSASRRPGCQLVRAQGG